MEGTTYGYVRVSTQEQNEARQLAAMREFGVAEQNIIVEKLSGRDFNRPRYQRLVRGIGAEDVLVVKSIDRLGRNYEEILNQWGFITKKRKAAIVVLDMPLLDTRRGKDLMGTFLSDIVLQSGTDRAPGRLHRSRVFVAGGRHFIQTRSQGIGNFLQNLPAQSQRALFLRIAAGKGLCVPASQTKQRPFPFDGIRALFFCPACHWPPHKKGPKGFPFQEKRTINNKNALGQ